MVSRSSKAVFALTVMALGLAIGLAWPAAAEQPKPPANRLYLDEDYDFRLVPPPGWYRYNPMQISVPGEICRVWTPDGTTTIVAFIQKPDTPMHPRQLLDSSAASMKQLGAVVREQEVRTVAAMQAMWLIVEGDGTGGALTEKGEVRTSQHWVAIPRERDILVLLLTGPASGFTAGETAFKAMLDTLNVGRFQTSDQRGSEPPRLPAAAANLDFEASPAEYDPHWGWYQAGVQPASGGEGYEVGADREVAHGGKASGRIRLATDRVHTFGTLTQAISAESFRGKRVRLSGWLRTQDVTSGWAGLWLRVDPHLAFDNMEGRGVTGTKDWSRYEVVLDVPEQAAGLAFGALLVGKGAVWVDDLSVETVGKEVPTTR